MGQPEQQDPPQYDVNAETPAADEGVQNPDAADRAAAAPPEYLDAVEAQDAGGGAGEAAQAPATEAAADATAPASGAGDQ